MRTSKNAILTVAYNHLVAYPTPLNFNYLNGSGSLAGVCLVIQIISGVLLAMHYIPSGDLAFMSVEHIMRDVNFGWLLRYTHANGSSMFFLCIYIHIARGLYYGSFVRPRHFTWISGVVIFILLMAVAFLGYVLPWGQMSFWAATVITNLFSAIPLIGPSIVEWLWGAFSVDSPAVLGCEIELKILLCAETPYLKAEYEMALSLFCLLSVKKSAVQGQSAGVRRFFGKLSPASVNALQRLHAGDLIFSYFVGFIEGDGYFTITKNGKYIKWEFGVELSSRDLQLIYKIKTLLGAGVVDFRVQKGSEKVSFRIRDKYTLINLIFPIFDKYPMFTNKVYDYLRFKEQLLSGKFLHAELPTYTRPTLPLNSVELILSSLYFDSWLIGFIEAEGCFSIYQPTNSTSKVGSFDISQTGAENIILAIRHFLYFTSFESSKSHIYLDKTGNYKLKLSGVQHIEKTIEFMQRTPIKLLGYKRLQYLKWLSELRQIPRYATKITIPTRY